MSLQTKPLVGKEISSLSLGSRKKFLCRPRAWTAKIQFYRSIGYEIPQFTRDGMKMISRKILSNRIFEKAVKKISRKIQIPTHLFPTYVER